MIFFWNRREVYFGNSMQKCGEVRDILASNNIKYQLKVLGHNSSAERARYGSPGVNLDYAYQYYVFVHNKDYEHACYLLHIEE